MAMRIISQVIVIIYLCYKNQFTLIFVINENIKEMLYLLIFHNNLQINFI